MLSLPPTVRIWLAAQPADLRKSFDSLAALVRDGLQGDPLSGDIFVFRNKAADRIKLLVWEEDGYAIWYKNQATDCPPTDGWNTPTCGAHNRVARTDSTCGLVPGSSNEHAPGRLSMSGHTRATVPPRARRSVAAN